MEKTMQNPKLIPVPFANSGIKDDIPKVKSTSMSDEKASWETGFPEATMLPVYAGGLPPDGKDFNGVLNQISENLVFQSKGGRYKFDPDFALSIGGYQKGATLQTNDESAEYQSLIDNNLVNFNTATPEEIAQAWRITGLGDATEVLNGKFDKASVKNELGLSQTEVVSQKVVTELGSGVVGSFENGLNYIEELTNSDQQVTFENEFGKQPYYWDGDLPKQVPAGSTPQSTGGIGKGAWVSVGDASLRGDLGGEYGAGLVSFKPSEIAGAVKLSVSDILDDGLTVKNFGAKGNWNATTQTGSDDTDAFEAYAAYINTLQNPRSGGARVMRVPAGSYRLDGFKITQGEAYWSFNMIGEGQLTQLWFNPNGEGIILGNENSQFSNITLNGKLNPSYPTTQDPAIPYIVRAKLDNKLTDVDLVCNKVDVFWYHCFARIAGRGFTFKNGTVGMGGQGGLCEIACDDDLIISGDTPSIHSLEASMRHFKVEGSRFDVNSRVFKITGSHPVKEYINGLTISDCELTNCTTLIESTDCRLVSPIFSGNLTIGCFTSSRSSGVINVPRAVNVQDINNSWNNYINPENVADSRDKGISYVHRYTDIDGLTIRGTTAKDLVFGVVRATGNCKGVSITGNTLLGFGDLQNNATILESEQTPEYVDISHNTISSKTAKSRRWLSSNEIQSGTIQISNNNCDSTFPVQGLIFKPTMIGANGSWSTYAEYRLESGYIAMDFICTSSNCTSTTGVVKISVPVQVRPLEINLTDRFSGAVTVGDILGFSFSGGGSVNLVADSSENAIVVKRMTNLKMSNLSYAERDSQTVSIKGSIRYKA